MLPFLLLVVGPGLGAVSAIASPLEFEGINCFEKDWGLVSGYEWFGKLVIRNSYSWGGPVDVSLFLDLAAVSVGK